MSTAPSASPPLVAGFSARVIQWQRAHGRHGLPWQGTRDAYRVWLSEIMLQQTQVSTVLRYYPRFLARFPTVHALAAAHEDEVLALWSGLGYYSRARNLHRCAQAVVQHWGGQFPPSAIQLATLPGIGRSTAAAIAAFCHGERAAILDGNVKRVLTRAFARTEDLAQPAQAQTLWQLAESLLPPPGGNDPHAMSAYTQGLMDLGAGICTLRRPACPRCPLQAHCLAHQQGTPERYPVKTRRPRPTELPLWLLHATDPHNRVLLVQRPARGIWARLWCLPMADTQPQLLALLSPGRAHGLQAHPPLRHALTHRQLHLHIHTLPAAPTSLASSTAGQWFAPGEWPHLGLPAPIRRWLQAQG